MAVCLILMQMADTASAQPLDVNVLAGQWARIDGNYALRVRDVMPDGTAEVGYFNPGKIHVAESRVTFFLNCLSAKSRRYFFSLFTMRFISLKIVCIIEGK